MLREDSLTQSYEDQVGRMETHLLCPKTHILIRPTTTTLRLNLAFPPATTDTIILHRPSLTPRNSNISSNSNNSKCKAAI